MGRSTDARAVKDLTETEAAYIAGIIDGEGCISIQKVRSGNAKIASAGYAYRGCVAVKMTDESLVRWFQEVTGLGSAIKAQVPSGNRRQAWAWTCWSKQALALLNRVRPHLRLKGAQADNLAAFQYGMRFGGRQALTHSELAQREHHYQVSRKLNERGLSRTT